MARVLAIDYGTKRSGLAVTDSLEMIAGPLDTVRSADLIVFLKRYTAKETVRLFIVGMPRTLSNELSDNARHVQACLNLLRKHFPEIPVETYDERFTSSMARQTILDSGVNRKTRQDKALVDMVSASIILQGWLESEQFKKNRS